MRKNYDRLREQYSRKRQIDLKTNLLNTTVAEAVLEDGVFMQEVVI